MMQQELNRLPLPCVGSEHQRILAPKGSGMEIGAIFNQQVQQVHMPLLRSHRQSSFSNRVRESCIRAMLKQE